MTGILRASSRLYSKRVNASGVFGVNSSDILSFTLDFAASRASRDFKWSNIPTAPLFSLHDKAQARLDDIDLCRCPVYQLVCSVQACRPQA